MFLRRCERRKNGKRHTYWALVESYRTAKGSRQRVVAYLGELKRSEQDGWAKLGAHLEKGQQSQRPQPSLFDPPSSIEPGREEVPWPTDAAILVLARFCEPASELHIEEKWYPRTALEDLLGIAPEKVHTVKTIIEALEKKYGTLNRVWVMDRGMVSEENLKFMRERNRQYNRWHSEVHVAQV